MRRKLVSLATLVALLGAGLAGAVVVAPSASAVETITSSPASYDPTLPVTITVDGFPNMAPGFGYVYWLDFQNVTGAVTNTGASTGVFGSQVDCAVQTGVTFATVAGPGSPVPNGQSAAPPSTNGCEWISPTKFTFSYSGTAALDNTSQVSITFPAGSFTLPAGGQYGVNFTAGAAQQWQLSYACWGNCPVGGSNSPPQVTLGINGNGGTCSESALTGTLDTWTKAPGSSLCTRSGFVYMGLNTSADGSGIQVPFAGDVYFAGDNTLYAIWYDPQANNTAPGAPTNVVATSLWNRIQVNWTAPVDHGSTQIFNYLVQASPGAQVCITSVARDRKPTQCSFNGVLTAGKKYTFTVSALNYDGWGDQSIASAPASPQGLRITGYKRSKVFLSSDSKVDVGGVAAGYASRTKVTPWVKVGESGAWVAQKSSPATVNGSGKFAWSARFKKNASSQNIYVKFTADGTNFTNVIQIRPSGSATSVKQIYIVRKDREVLPLGRQRLRATAQTHGFKKGDPLEVWLKWGAGTFEKAAGPVKVAADGTVTLNMPIASRYRGDSVKFYFASPDGQVKSNEATETAP